MNINKFKIINKVSLWILILILITMPFIMLGIIILIVFKLIESILNLFKKNKTTIICRNQNDISGNDYYTETLEYLED